MLLRRKKVMWATESWNKYHLYTELPFVKAGLTAVTEEKDGCFLAVSIKMRLTFEEEERCVDWEHRDWFFTTWRRFQHSGILTEALEFFFNECEGKFEKIPLLFQQIQDELVEYHAEAVEAVGSISLSETNLDKFEVVNQQYLHTPAKRLLWCKLCYVIGRYLEYEHEKCGGTTDTHDDRGQA